MKLWLAALLSFPLFAADKLAIVNAFFEEPDGRVIRTLTLNAGETNYFSFKVAGYKADTRQRVLLNYKLDCLDPKGVPVVETLADKVDVALSPQDERWMPKVSYSVVIPDYAPSGDYLIRVQVEDQIGKTDARYEAPFKVRGETEPPGEKLELRRFVLADTEAGPAKSDNVYHAGSMLWARFKLTGYRITPEKEYWVQYGLTVSDAAGKVLYTNPEAAVEKHQQFYPPQVLNSAFNLDLQKGVKPGEYTIRLEVHDSLGKQDITHETKFVVEP